MKQKFNYGTYIISFRKEKDGLLHFLEKRIDTLEDALKSHHKLQDLGYHDVLIKKNKK